MKIFTGRVVNGNEVPPDEFPDGTEVAVLPAESQDTFTLTPEESAELQESMSIGADLKPNAVGTPVSRRAPHRPVREASLMAADRRDRSEAE